MKTHITVPCPTACEAIKEKINILVFIPKGLLFILNAIIVREIMYPIEPINISFFLPILSIKIIPK